MYLKSLLKTVMPFAFAMSNIAFGEIPSDINRIETAANEAARCHNVSNEVCTKKRDKALKKECINEKEFNTLKDNNDYPLCDYDFEDLDMLSGWCPCGCFEESVEISVAEKGIGIREEITAKQLRENYKKYDVFSLGDDATLDSVYLETRGIKKVTYGVEKPKLVILNMENSKTLKLTEKHGVLLSDGRMIKAIDVKVGDKLVTDNGEFIPVSNITREHTSALVYNFATAEPDSNRVSHTLIAEGFVVGDLVWQNNLETELGKIAVRQSKNDK